jgi:hypothetical protein
MDMARLKRAVAAANQVVSMVNLVVDAKYLRRTPSPSRKFKCLLNTPSGGIAAFEPKAEVL